MLDTDKESTRGRGERTRMRHVNAEKLIEYMDGQLTEQARAMIDGHLSHCSDCQETNQELHQFAIWFQSDSSYEPPAEALQWGITLFQPMLQPAESAGSKVRKIVASLVFDTFDEPA